MEHSTNYIFSMVLWWYSTLQRKHFSNDCPKTIQTCLFLYYVMRFMHEWSHFLDQNHTYSSFDKSFSCSAQIRTVLFYLTLCLSHSTAGQYISLHQVNKEEVMQSIFWGFEIIILNTTVSHAISMIHFCRFTFTIFPQEQHWFLVFVCKCVRVRIFIHLFAFECV